MQIIEGVKIELNSTDIENIVDEWAKKKMAEFGNEITSSKKDEPFHDLVYFGQKKTAKK